MGRTSINFQHRFLEDKIRSFLRINGLVQKPQLWFENRLLDVSPVSTFKDRLLRWIFYAYSAYAFFDFYEHEQEPLSVGWWGWESLRWGGLVGLDRYWYLILFRLKRLQPLFHNLDLVSLKDSGLEFLQTLGVGIKRTPHVKQNYDGWCLSLTSFTRLCGLNRLIWPRLWLRGVYSRFMWEFGYRFKKPYSNVACVNRSSFVLFNVRQQWLYTQQKSYRDVIVRRINNSVWFGLGYYLYNLDFEVLCSVYSNINNYFHPIGFLFFKKPIDFIKWRVSFFSNVFREADWRFYLKLAGFLINPKKIKRRISVGFSDWRNGEFETSLQVAGQSHVTTHTLSDVNVCSVLTTLKTYERNLLQNRAVGRKTKLYGLWREYGCCRATALVSDRRGQRTGFCSLSLAASMLSAK